MPHPTLLLRTPTRYICPPKTRELLPQRKPSAPETPFTLIPRIRTETHRRPVTANDQTRGHLVTDPPTHSTSCRILFRIRCTSVTPTQKTNSPTERKAPNTTYNFIGKERSVSVPSSSTSGTPGLPNTDTHPLGPLETVDDPSVWVLSA